MSVDSSTYTFSKRTLSTKWKVANEASLPFSLDESGKDSIINSEVKHEAWFIENPISKELTKRITLKLGPKAEQEFIIVVRSPSNNLKKQGNNLLSVINIGVLTYKDEQFGVKESFEDFLKVNYGNSMKEFLRDRKKLT